MTVHFHRTPASPARERRLADTTESGRQRIVEEASELTLVEEPKLSQSHRGRQAHLERCGSADRSSFGEASIWPTRHSELEPRANEAEAEAEAEAGTETLDTG